MLGKECCKRLIGTKLIVDIRYTMFKYFFTFRIDSKPYMPPDSKLKFTCSPKHIWPAEWINWQCQQFGVIF